jgi:endonuclease YncB( thermonuclease family)
MQIHIHKDGKTYGPYPLEQVRQYLKAGNFTGNDYACHDGANWIKLSQVPGVAPSKPKTVAKSAVQAKPKKKKKIRKVRLVVVSLCVLLLLSLIALSIVGLINLMIDDGDESTSSNELFILTPDQIVDVYDGDTFKIDLPSMHPLFGDDISIRLFGVDTPEMKGTSDEVKALAMQAQELTEKALKGASKIELRNPQRGKYFRIISEVWIDGESLADMLKAKGLAKDYDGEGARPEW